MEEDNNEEHDNEEDNNEEHDNEEDNNEEHDSMEDKVIAVEKSDEGNEVVNETPANYTGKLTDDVSGEPPSFMDTIYEQITSVIGGDNPNQFFCMLLPGILIDATQYEYEVDDNGLKPSHVKANESNLANKLFDACKTVASDNGRHLSTQYKTALDTLTPKLNRKLFEAKNKLRKVLMIPYPYRFDNESTGVFTLEQVFYKLYAEYIEAKRVWSEKQFAKKDSLNENYHGNASEVNDKFLDWYGTVGEAEELVLEEKLGKVLSVFSPGDMKIIVGILDSGIGREIAEARASVDNVREINPNGGYVYPVTLYPHNWAHNLLNTSFTEMDLLESPAAFMQKLTVLGSLRSKTIADINTLTQTIPGDGIVEALKKASEESRASFHEAVTKLTETYTGCTAAMIKEIMDVMVSLNINSVIGVPDIVGNKICLNASLFKSVKDAADVFDASAKKCSRCTVKCSL